MKRHLFFPAVVLLSTVAIPLTVRSQETPVVYELTGETRFAEGCFFLCDCLIIYTDDIQGSFVLTEVGEEEGFRLFDVTDVDWIVSLGSEQLVVTGQGEYRIGGASGIEQQLDLQLVINDLPVRKFMSGLADADRDFPEIDAVISMNFMTECTDTVFHIVAAPVPEAIPFVRGDCNGDGVVSERVADAIFGLRYLFARAASEPPCLAACDANGDGDFSGVEDALYTLRFNFRGGPPPPPPFPECGVDADGLACETPTCP